MKGKAWWDGADTRWKLRIQFRLGASSPTLACYQYKDIVGESGSVTKQRQTTAVRVSPWAVRRGRASCFRLDL